MAVDHLWAVLFKLDFHGPVDSESFLRPELSRAIDKRRFLNRQEILIHVHKSLFERFAHICEQKLDSAAPRSREALVLDEAEVTEACQESQQDRVW